jgi:hypothetical protein
MLGNPKWKSQGTGGLDIEFREIAIRAYALTFIQIDRKRIVMNRRKIWKVSGVALLLCGLTQAGTLTTFDAPGAGTGSGQGTFANDINPAGAITGYYLDGNGAYHGFLRAPDGAITTFDAPGAGASQYQGTLAISLDPAGAVAGYYYDDNTVAHGFVRATDGSFIRFDVSAAGTGYGQGTEAANINPAGAIAGVYLDANDVFHGFLRAPDGAITTFDVPGAGTGRYQGTITGFASCLSPAGAIAGYYIDANGAGHGYERAPDGAITRYNASGAGTASGQGTFAFTINPAGTSAGQYIDANGAIHGFLREPNGAITAFDVSGAGTGSGQVRSARASTRQVILQDNTSTRTV